MGTRPTFAQGNGSIATNRGDGKTNREPAGDENKCGTASERIEMILTDSELIELVAQMEGVDRIAVDTEADSLHCYYEKLCLIQLTFDGNDHLIDPLAPIDLQPLCSALADREMVLQGMDFDLRLLR